MYYCNKSGRPLPPYSVLRNIWTVPNWMIILCKKQVQSLAGQTRRLQIIRNKEEAPASDFASQLRVSPIFSQSQKYSIFFKKYSSKFQSDKNIPLSPLFLFNFLPNTKNIPCYPQFFFQSSNHKDFYMLDFQCSKKNYYCWIHNNHGLW